MASKNKSTKEESPKNSTETVEQTVDQSVGELNEKPSVLRRCDVMEDRLKQAVSLFKEMKSELKEVRSEFKKEMKNMKKGKKNRSSDKSNKGPSGFNKPELVPRALCEFLGLEEGSELKRTDVTKQLYNYIKSNNLQTEDDKRIIEPDDKLRKLFDMGSNDTIQFNTFQKYVAKVYRKDKEELDKKKNVDEKKDKKKNKKNKKD